MERHSWGCVLHRAYGSSQGAAPAAQVVAVDPGLPLHGAVRSPVPPGTAVVTQTMAEIPGIPAFLGVQEGLLALVVWEVSPPPAAWFSVSVPILGQNWPSLSAVTALSGVHTLGSVLRHQAPATSAHSRLWIPKSIGGKTMGGLGQLSHWPSGVPWHLQPGHHEW